MEAIRYPIGRFDREAPVHPQDYPRLLGDVEELPSLLKEALAGLSDDQLNTPYRPGGWTLRQVVHHLADSHMNAYVRFKLGLTEETPAVKTYEEDRWGELPDARSAPVGVSLRLLEALHVRWLACLRGVDSADFERKVIHPVNGPMTLAGLLGLYAWHGKHHLAHILRHRRRMGW